MKLLNAFAIVATFGLAHAACAQTHGLETSARTDSSASLDAKWVSAIVGMKVETPAGGTLGRVKDVVVDGYGRASYAIVSYGGMLGLGNKYTAIPWTTVADMLHNDRLLIDPGQLENAPVLSAARPDSASTTWRHEAETYWRGKVALGHVAVKAPATPDANASVSPSETPPTEPKP